MFTEKLMGELEASFQERLRRMGGNGECGEKAAQLERMAREDSDEAEAMKCLYASMPLSDAVDYPVELFRAYARHGAFLWEKGPFAGRVPERLFAGYVLHHRVNNENLTEHREFFYGELKDRIAGMDMRQAVREANYWCASQVTYRSTDERTASPMSVYNCAYGRCGEESTFTVSVLRSLGIPARQVYAPLWSHCDDNHAWVEAWCDGEWVFFGACEPEEVLDRGWFSGASSRAMLVHSRWLLPIEESEEGEGAPQVLPGNDMCHALNQLERYALTTDQEVAVYDKAGKTQPDALVRFEVMNMACYGEIASVRTDGDGKCRLRTGLGSLHVTASKDGAYGEALVDTREGKCCDIILDAAAMQSGQWEELTFFAPKDFPKNAVPLSNEEKSRGRKRLEEMNRLRREKESHFFDEALARETTAGLEAEARDRWVAIMRKACRNQKEIAAFLSNPVEGAYPERWKLAALESLREKDYRDITAGILEESCRGAAEWEGVYQDCVLVPYILCPRVWNEMIRPFRCFILGWLERESAHLGRNLAEEIRRNPVEAWKLAKERIREDKGVEYGSLVTSAEGALESGYGSRRTREVVCVQILRTLGIPARLDLMEGVPEVWVSGRFVPLEQHERTCRIRIRRPEETEWNYFGNWSLARFEEDGYRPLWLGFQDSDRITESIPAFPGKYRVLTANRLPNGNILAKEMYFSLGEREEKEISLELAAADSSDLLTDYDIMDFSLRREDGTSCPISHLVKERSGLFIWLGEDEEPTEHILNEIYERREAYAQIGAGLYFVAARPRIRENPACGRVLAALPEVELLYDEFGPDMETLARRMYLEPGKLPLVVIINPSMAGVYGVAGYNVGTGDMVLKLLDMVRG